MPRLSPERTPRSPRVLSALVAVTVGVLGALLPVSAASAAGIATGQVLDQAGDPVVGVEVRILCEGSGTGYAEIERVDTDMYGEFRSTDPLPDGNCQAYLYEGEADETGQWVSTALEFFVVAGGPVTTPVLRVSRYVPISGTIANWTPEMGNVTVSLREEVAPGVWQLVNNTPRPNYVDSDGADFTLSSPLDAEEYTLYFQFADNRPYLDAYLGGELDDATLAQTFTGVPNVGVDDLTMTMPDAAAISGRVTSGGQPLAGIEVEADNGESYTSDETDVNGEYTLYVRPGSDYYVYAYGDNSHRGAYYYTGSDPCGCEYDPVTTSVADPAEAIDIDLVYELALIDIEAAAFDDETFDAIDGTTIRLYAASGDGWVLVDAETIDLNASGSVSFREIPQAHYRLQFVRAGVIMTVTDGAIFDSGMRLISPVPACYAELGAVDDSLAVVGGLDAATAAGACAALPAPTAVTPPSGGSGTTPPAGGPRRPVATATTPDASVTPTPTPSATPSPSATPRPTPEATPAATEPDPASGPDLWWLLWVGLGLLVIVVISGVVFFVRRM